MEGRRPTWATLDVSHSFVDRHFPVMLCKTFLLGFLWFEQDYELGFRRQPRQNVGEGFVWREVWEGWEWDKGDIRCRGLKN